MPPYDLWLQGHEAIKTWMLGRGAACRGSVLVPVAASGAPAFAQYKDGGRSPWALIVLELDGDRFFKGLNFFLDTATLFPKFGLPMSVEPGAAGAGRGAGETAGAGSGLVGTAGAGSAAGADPGA
jgi:RNA polymerase sigma-70 factor (ECF subfamily)